MQNGLLKSAKVAKFSGAGRRGGENALFWGVDLALFRGVFGGFLDPYFLNKKLGNRAVFGPFLGQEGPAVGGISALQPAPPSLIGPLWGPPLIWGFFRKIGQKQP